MNSRVPLPALGEAPRSKRGLLRDDVYRYLRDAIVEGDYEPGDRLRDAELTELLGVSRTPVREALRRLEDEGLVEMWANRWTRVAPIDIREAERMYPIVWALERLALTEAESFPPERVEALRTHNARLKEALRRGDPVAASGADTHFHQALVDCWGNAEVVEILKDLKLRLRRVEIQYFGGSILAERSVIEHEAITEALQTGDLPAAADAVERNWRNSLERVRKRTDNADSRVDARGTRQDEVSP